MTDMMFLRCRMSLQRKIVTHHPLLSEDEDDTS